MTLLDHAMSYWERGFAVLPIDAEKKPPLQTWRRWQRERPSERQLKTWFRRNGLTGLAVLCGRVSGGLGVRDFDDETAYEDWRSVNPDLAATLPTVRTSRGYHVYFTGGIDRILTLPDGELSGAGYVLAPPSVHSDG